MSVLNNISFLSELEKKLSTGLTAFVISKLYEFLKFHKYFFTSSKERVFIAQLCRRAGIYEEGLKVLSPIIHPEFNSKYNTASEQELLEYANLISHIGSIKESIEILDALDSTLNPKVLLHKAFICFSRWDYVGALTNLQDFTKIVDDNSFDSLVGKANLLMCKVYLLREGFETQNSGLIENQLIDFINLLDQLNFNKLKLSMIEVLGQYFLSQRKFDLAKKYFEILLNESNLTQREKIFASKWYYINELEQSKTVQDNALKKLLTLKKNSMKVQNFETARDIDFHIGRIFKNEFLLNKVYFGTPFEQFKNRVERQLTQLNLRLADIFYFNSISNSNLIYSNATIEYINYIDSESKNVNSMNRSSTFVTPSCYKINNFDCLSHLEKQTFKLLLQDFYADAKIGSLHAQLYPKEYFNPFSSPQKIHSLVYRLNKSLNTNFLKLSVKFKTSGYSLKVNKNYSFLIENQLKSEFKSEKRIEVIISKIQSNFKSKNSFNRKDIETLFNVSARTANNYIGAVLNNGLAIKKGCGPAANYQMI